MTTDELKALCKAKAEEIARPHQWAIAQNFACPCIESERNYKCTCGRDAEVIRIAEALESLYAQGYLYGRIRPNTKE